MNQLLVEKNAAGDIQMLLWELEIQALGGRYVSKLDDLHDDYSHDATETAIPKRKNT